MDRRPLRRFYWSHTRTFPPARLASKVQRRVPRCLRCSRSARAAGSANPCACDHHQRLRRIHPYLSHRRRSRLCRQPGRHRYRSRQRPSGPSRASGRRGHASRPCSAVRSLAHCPCGRLRKPTGWWHPRWLPSPLALAAAVSPSPEAADCASASSSVLSVSRCAPRPAAGGEAEVRCLPPPLSFSASASFVAFGARESNSSSKSWVASGRSGVSSTSAVCTAKAENSTRKTHRPLERKSR